MADMLTFNGVPVATYGLTGILFAFLTGMTFIDTKGEADTSMTAVATASLPDFMGNMLTPTAPSFSDIMAESAKDFTQPSGIMDGMQQQPSNGIMNELSTNLMDKITTSASTDVKPKDGGGKKHKKTRKSTK